MLLIATMFTNYFTIFIERISLYTSNIPILSHCYICITFGTLTNWLLLQNFLYLKSCKYLLYIFHICTKGSTWNISLNWTDVKMRNRIANCIFNYRNTYKYSSTLFLTGVFEPTSLHILWICTFNLGKLILLHCVTGKKKKCISRKQFTSNLDQLFSVLNFCGFFFFS